MGNKFEQFIEKNLKRVVAEETAQTLGDRSKYIGASDIAGCLRKAYLSKISPIEHSLEQLLIFERGHLAENIVAKMLKGLHQKEQVEVVSKVDNGFEIKNHLDFVVYSKEKKECVVIEAKSVSSEIDEPYESHILQIQMQMGLLQEQCGEDWKVRGYIFAINVNNGWHKAFPIEQNKVLFDMAMQRANQLAEAIVNKQEPEGEEQMYCSSCPFKGDCPAVRKGAVEELPKEVAEIVKKIKAFSSEEKKIKNLKNELKEWFKATDKSRCKADDFTVSLVNVKGKEMADVKVLKEKYPEIWEQVKTVSNGYGFVKII
jgi:CRISPR-associated exonuclease Cas4